MPRAEQALLRLLRNHLRLQDCYVSAEYTVRGYVGGVEGAPQRSEQNCPSGPASLSLSAVQAADEFH